MMLEKDGASGVWLEDYPRTVTSTPSFTPHLFIEQLGCQRVLALISHEGDRKQAIII